MNIQLDKDYELKCSLGTIRELEETFNCSFNELITKVNKLTTEEQLRMLFCGVHRANPDMSKEKFFVLCDDYLGLGMLTDKLEEFIYQLQYPGKTQEEIDAIVQKKLAKAGQLRNSIGAEFSAQVPAGLKPQDIWEMQLWEFNSYMQGCEDLRKDETANAIMIGFYAGYYVNGGKKAKPPRDLIQRLYIKKQSREEGLREIERVKELERHRR